MTTPRSTLTPDYQRDWPAYFDSVAGKPPRETCIRALDAFEREDAATAQDHETKYRFAIDIGCGEGRDSRAMLCRAGPPIWKIMACDTSDEGTRRLIKALPSPHARRVRPALVAMESIPIKYRNGIYVASSRTLIRQIDLANASFALPFCDPDAFPRLWDWIVGMIRPGGRFVGQFFGDRDEWRPIRPQSHHTREQVLALLAPFHLEWLNEVEKDGDDAMGGAKHHHVFHVVARKK